jgi:hypothetical protein
VPQIPLWCGDLLIPAPFINPGTRGAWGCGIVLANMTAEEVAACTRLGRALERICWDDVANENDPAQANFQVGRLCDSV